MFSVNFQTVKQFGQFVPSNLQYTFYRDADEFQLVRPAMNVLKLYNFHVPEGEENSFWLDVVTMHRFEYNFGQFFPKKAYRKKDWKHFLR